MPQNVYVLASMNSVDRSVAPLDAALRRRFYVIELQPDYELVAQAFGLSELPEDLATLQSAPSEIVYWRRLTLRMLWRINLRIQTLVGDDFQLGHSYVLPLENVDQISSYRSQLASILNRRIIPQLEEMMRGNPEALASILNASVSTGATDYPFRVEAVPAELESVSSVGPLSIGRVNEENVEAVARALASVSA